jgi:hypothetical protein
MEAVRLVRGIDGAMFCHGKPVIIETERDKVMDIFNSAF